MAVISLKIKLNEVTTRLFRTSVDTLIGDLQKDVQEKMAVSDTEQDHGLFQPAQKGKPGHWLALNRTIKFYGIHNGDELEFKKKHKVISVKLMDDSVHHILVDTSKPVNTVLATVGEKLDLRNFEEFGLRRANSSEGEWLNNEATLCDQNVADDEDLVFAKRFFSNDFDVDMEDPRQLNLIYMQAFANVVSGKFDPLQRQEMVELAALQVQIVYGDHDPQRHKVGFLDVKQLVSPMFRKDKKIEADILKEHEKYVRMPQLQAKYRFMQVARTLKSYGITTFHVLEMVDEAKKKTVPYLLGITKDKLIKMDAETHDVVKEWPIEWLRRWAATKAVITLDFGDYDPTYTVFNCIEGDNIAALISGYIDIKLKARGGTFTETVVGAEEANITDQAPLVGRALMGQTVSSSSAEGALVSSSEQPADHSRSFRQLSHSVSRYQLQAPVKRAAPGSTVSTVAFPQTQKVNVIDLATALLAGKALLGELDQGIGNFQPGSTLTAEQWQDQMDSYSTALSAEIAKMLEYTRLDPSKMDKVAIDTTAKNMYGQMIGVAIASKNIAALTGNTPLLVSAKSLAEGISKMLGYVNKYSTDPAANRVHYLMEFAQAERALKATLSALEQAQKAHYVDKGSELVMIEALNEASVNLNEMINSSLAALNDITDPTIRSNVEGDAHSASVGKEWLVDSIRTMIPVAVDQDTLNAIESATIDIKTLANRLALTTKAAPGVTPATQARMDWATKRINDAIAMLVDARTLIEPRGAEGDLDMEVSSNLLNAALAQIRKNIDTPDKIIMPTKNAVKAANELVIATKTLANASDDVTRERLLKAAAQLGDRTSQMLDAIRVVTKDPENATVKSQVIDLAARLEAIAQDISTDAGVNAALIALRYYAKKGTAKMVRLQSAVGSSFTAISDQEVRDQLWKLSATLSLQIAAMVAALKIASAAPSDFVKQNDLLLATDKNLPGYHEYLVATIKSQKAINDPNKKQDVVYSATDAGEALKKLEQACKAVGGIGGQTDIEEALADFDAVKVELDAADFSASRGLLTPQPGQTRENSQELLVLASRTLSKTAQHLADAAKLGGKLPPHVKEAAAAISQLAAAVRDMASTTTDRPTQRRIIAVAKEICDATLHLVGSGRVLVIDRQNKDKAQNVESDLSRVNSTLASLSVAAKGLDSHECDEAMESIRSDSTKIAPQTGTATPFKVASQSLASVSKAMAASISQLIAMARSNPRGIGSSAKIAATTMSQLVRAVNVAAGCGDQRTAADLISAARNLSNALLDLVTAAKVAAADRDAAAMENLNKAGQRASDALQTTLAILGGSVTSDADAAIKIIMEALQQVDKMEDAHSKTRSELLDEFSAASQGLASVSTRLVTASRVSAGKVGDFSHEAAATTQQLLEAARASNKAVKDGISGHSPITSVANSLGKYCHVIMDNSSDTTKIVPASVRIAKAGATVISLAKQAATKLSAPEDKEKQQRLLKVTKLITNDVNALGKLVQEMATTKKADLAPKVKEVAETLKNEVHEFEHVCHKAGISLTPEVGASSEVVDATTAQQLTIAARTCGVAMSELIRASANVAADKDNDEASKELSKCSRAMSDALSSLIQAAMYLNPGIQECIKAEEIIQNVSTDLDALAIDLGAGTAQLKAPEGKTHTQVQEELVNNCKTLGDDVNHISHSATAENEIKQLVAAAKELQQHMEAFQAIVRAAVATSSTPELRKYYLDTAKIVMDQVSGFLKQVKVVNSKDKASVATLTAYANNSNQALGYIIAALQSGTSMMHEIEAAIETLKRVSATINTPADAAATKKRYGQFREDLVSYVSRELAEVIQKMATTMPDTVGQLGLHTKRVGEGFQTFVDNVRGAAACTPDAQAKQAIVNEASNLTKYLLGVMECAKNMSRDPQNVTVQQQLHVSSQPFFSETAKFISALRKGAVGERMCDDAVAEIQKAITQLNTSAIFAQAGQLEADKSALANTITQMQDSLMQSAKSVGTAAAAVVESTKQVQEEALGRASTDLAKLISAIAVTATQIASRVNNDSNLQQDLLSATKMVGIRAHQLILASKDIERNPHDQSVQKTFKSSVDGIGEALSHLAEVANGAAASASLGERELETARKVIFALIQNIPGYDSATPEDVIKAARDVTASVADLVFALSQEEIVEAAHRSLVSTEKLLNSAASASKLSSDPAVSKALVDAVRTTAQTMMSLLEVAKLSGSDPSTQQKREAASAEVTNSLNQVVTALHALPNAQNLSLDEGADLEALANEELMKAAQVIEEAAATLMKAKPKPANADPNLIDESTIANAILGAAQAITQATGSLVTAARVAQAERAERHKNVSAGAAQKYHNDPTWANGLISSAKAVAAAVKQLVNAANRAAQGKADHETLIAAARAVAAATAQLVVACRAKADLLSKGQQQLTVAAKAVSDATAKLVDATQHAMSAAASEKEAAEATADGFSASMQAKFDQQIKILKLEAQIEAERKRLTRMNKAEYTK